jgi:hypothetical protein
MKNTINYKLINIIKLKIFKKYIIQMKNKIYYMLFKIIIKLQIIKEIYYNLSKSYKFIGIIPL